MTNRRTETGRTACDGVRAEMQVPNLDELDPAKIDPVVWNAAQDEWDREGHEADTIPLQRKKFEALLRRRRVRIEFERTRDQRDEDRRRSLIEELKAPRSLEIPVDSKSILDAEAAYQEGREKLVERWTSKYEELPNDLSYVWDIYHVVEGDLDVPLRVRTPTDDQFPSSPMIIKKAFDDPKYREFERFSLAIQHQLEVLDANRKYALFPPTGSRLPLKGWSLDEIDENDGSAWLVPQLIPHGLTFVYGLPKSGKSLWMQKLSACIAGGAPFDGIERLEHGRVLYISRDIGASRQEVKKRFIKILPHLGLAEDALNGKLILTDDPFYLNVPESVEDLLVRNPGQFVLVVIDSLFRCVSGSLSQDVVAIAAVDAIGKISQATGAAIVAVHHEPRSGEHLFGSVMLDAAYDSQIHVERGKGRESVTVTVQELKNAPIPDRPFTYRIEQGYLAAVAGAEALSTTKQAVSRHQEMLALLPVGWFTRKEGRNLVEPLLSGSAEAKRKQWQRAIAGMEASGQIEVKARRMRKT